jgi:hypothetical protein
MDTADRARCVREDGFVVLRAVIDELTVERLGWRSLARIDPFATVADDLLGPFTSSVHGRNPLPGGGQQGLHADRPTAGPLAL